ncbi:hypothetical protein BDZ94DRAFT_1217283 [Collybia nuda]|uniref:DUF3533 domain-containing protein n=1 Tax=Collybia nuda TaxID=64659 RepID=A0A9P6CJ12_9AGAR|nr:hypothetical protein BDZ94DRAFT_1217283 [Collybia nuda]
MPVPHDERRRSSPATSITVPPPPLFTQSFFARENASARVLYLRTLVGGCFAIVIIIFAIFSIYWGALWKTPVRNLNGWIVDFDNALIGTTVKEALMMPSPQSKVTWKVVPMDQFPGGVPDVERAVKEEKTWLVLAVNQNATARLTASYANPDRAYNGSSAVTVYAAEARNENAFRVLIRPSVQTQLAAVGMQFAEKSVGSLLTNSTGTSAASVTSILATSPQTVLAPLGFTMVNILPFDKPVASAVTFVGLIYQLILTFFVVMMSSAARDASGFGKSLSLGSLVVVRLLSAFVAYFFLALFYTLLSVAFQLDFTRQFGHAGIVVFWMLNWVGMLSVGLALESLITLLTIRFIPFFLLSWIIVNVGVCIFPIEVMPAIFRYGYATPFYNISRAVRCIVFGTKNDVGKNFGILIVWVAISCITLPLFQWIVRRQDIRAAQSEGTDRGSEGRVIDISAGAGTGGVKGESAGVPEKGGKGVYAAAGDVHHASGDLDMDMDVGLNLSLGVEVRKLGLRTAGAGEGGEEGVILVGSRSRSLSGSGSESRTPRRGGEEV